MHFRHYPALESNATADVQVSETAPESLFTCAANSHFVDCLSRYAVRFIVIGGLAVKYWVPDREVDDLDLLIEPTATNFRSLTRAFIELRLFPDFALDDFLSASPKQIPIKDYYYVDLIVLSRDVDFLTEWEHASLGHLGRTPVRFASIDFLLRQKGASQRHKDREDVLHLLAASPC